MALRYSFATFTPCSATGAAATAVVTAAVGGPLAMGAIVAGGTGAVAYGLYRLGGWIGDQMK